LDLCVEARNGICETHAAVGLLLFEKAGFQWRPVEFYYEDKKQLNHVVSAVKRIQTLSEETPKPADYCVTHQSRQRS
jgi:hypothetical protein